MSELWKKWEGQVADHKYHLRHYLGSTDHSVVFLAEFHEPELRQAAVKFISADLANSEKQLAAWSTASQLSHPNLMRIYGAGRCRIEEMDLLYVAMEYAEENLAQVLPHRALMAEETSEMLNSVVDVLVYLHAKNLTHGHIKPSNVLASGELLKLSSDTIYPAGEVREMRRERTAYDAPELPDSPYTPAADVWSLGVTLVEAFTQQPAILPFNEQADPMIPPAIRAPFLEIARHTLRREPKLRWSTSKLAERLNPAAAAAKAVAASASAGARSSAAMASASAATMVAPPEVSPVTVPLSKEPAVPLARLQAARPVRRAASPPPVREEGIAPAETVVLPNYVIPVFAGALVLIALILLPFVLRHRTQTAAGTVTSSVSAGSTNAPATRPSASQNNVPPPAKQPSAAAKPTPQPPAPTRPQPLDSTPAPAILRGTESAPVPAPKNSSSAVGRGEVLDQVMPEASAKALGTIQGTVRVGVKVRVDAAGNVSEATLDNPGPSKYFADLALKAAQRWVFSPPEANGRSVPSDWAIQFGFTQNGAKATANQIQP
jgi:TonB family protein